MSNNVIDFTSKKSIQEIQELRQTLDFCYKQVDDTYECLNEMEQSLELIQQNYNQKLVEIVQKLGPDYITPEDLNYATNLIISGNGDGTVSVSLSGVVAGSWNLSEEEV